MLVGGWVFHAAGAVPLLLTCGASNLFTFTYAIDASDSDHLHWPIDFLQVALSHEVHALSILASMTHVLCEKQVRVFFQVNNDDAPREDVVKTVQLSDVKMIDLQVSQKNYNSVNNHNGPI